MRAALVSVWVVVSLAACTWMQDIEVAPDARRHAKVALAAYESTQQAMIIYGRLPACSEVVVKFCRDQVIWNNIKIADKLAVQAITAATPVLAGEDRDDGQIIKAMIAIDQVTVALRAAQQKWGGVP